MACVMKAVGRVWSVHVTRTMVHPMRGRETHWHGGSIYNYGIGEARYLVPAKPLTVDYWWDTVGIFEWNGNSSVIVGAFVKR